MNTIYARDDIADVDVANLGSRNQYKPLFKKIGDKSFITFSFWENRYNSDNSFYFFSTYIERFWLGILGPSSTWLLRITLTELELEDAPLHFTSSVIAARIGLADNTSWNSPLSRSIRRLIDFKIAKQTGLGHISISRYVPPLSLRQVSILSHDEASLHSRYMNLLRTQPNFYKNQLEFFKQEINNIEILKPKESNSDDK